MKHILHVIFFLGLFTFVVGGSMATFAEPPAASAADTPQIYCGRGYFRPVFDAKFDAGPGAKDNTPLTVSKGSTEKLLELQDKGCEFRVHFKYENAPPEGIEMVTPTNLVFSCAATETSFGELWDRFDCRGPMLLQSAFGGYFYMDRISLERNPSGLKLLGSRIVQYPENKTFDTFDLIQPLGKGEIHIYAKR